MDTLRFKSQSGAVKDIDAKGVVTMYVSSFGNLDSQGDTITKGAYSDTVKNDFDRIRFLFNHDPNQLIGRPLELKEDDYGLLVRAKLSNVRNGDFITLYQDKVLTEHSVKIELIDFDENDQYKDAGGYRIDKVKLWEFSAVTWGADKNTPVIGMKSQLDVLTKQLHRGNLTDDTYSMLEALVKDIEGLLKNQDRPATRQDLIKIMEI